jgi:DNA polymerase III epsilon subunit-like protein
MKNFAIEQKDIIFLDIETSSLRPDADILEIGGLITDSELKIKESFNYLIKPKDITKSDPKSLKIIGFSEDKWKDAKDLEEVLKILYPKFKDKIFAGWINHFDWARLEKAFFNIGLDDPFDYRKIDIFSMAVSRFGIKNLGDKETLSKICKTLSIERGKSHQALSDAYASYKVFLKIINYDQEEVNKETTENLKIEAYTDGGAINNPGKAAISCVIKIKDQIKKFSQEIGVATNNQAEYLAIIFCLEKIKHLIGKEKSKNSIIIINTDSQVVGGQIQGKFKILEENLFKYFIKFHNLKIDFKEIQINIIPREKNLADTLVKKVLFHKFSTLI